MYKLTRERNKSSLSLASLKNYRAIHLGNNFFSPILCSLIIMYFFSLAIVNVFLLAIFKTY